MSVIGNPICVGGGGSSAPSDIKMWTYTHGSADTKSGYVTLISADTWLAQHRQDNNLVINIFNASDFSFNNLSSKSYIQIINSNSILWHTTQYSLYGYYAVSAATNYYPSISSSAATQKKVYDEDARISVTSGGDLNLNTSSAGWIRANSKLVIIACLVPTS